MENTKLPRAGTIARAVVDALAAAGPSGATFTHLMEVYWAAQATQLGDAYRGRGNFIGASRYRRNAMNLNPILRKHGVKLGRPGTRAPWVARTVAQAAVAEAIGAAVFG